jgi:hypothetical protein
MIATKLDTRLAGRAIAYGSNPHTIVTLNLFQGPFLVSIGGSWGAMDAETRSA